MYHYSLIKNYVTFTLAGMTVHKHIHTHTQAIIPIRNLNRFVACHKLCLYMYANVV